MRLLVVAAALALVGCGEGDSSSRGGSGGNGGAGGSGGSSTTSGGGGPTPVAFARHELHDLFYSEGAAFGDFDRDGVVDVVAGPFWYSGPDFTLAHELYPPVGFDPHGYSDNFFAFVHDVDADAWPDVIVVGFPGQSAAWFENPGAVDGSWTRHQIVNVVDTESPTFTDLTGDGDPELVCANGGRLGWATPDPADPTAPWTFHPLSPDLGFAAFTHGLGVGDVNGDGRADVIEATGWWEQPSSLTGDPVWTRHEQDFGPGGAQIYVLDVDGDGDGDVVTTLQAHGYGVAWFEQAEGAFVQHLISGGPPDEPLALFEPHALFVSDVNGDGLDDLVGGERFWGHVPEGDPSFDAPAKLVWFELRRDEAGASFTPHVIDDQSGVGTQVVAGDVDGDTRPDVVVANKKGAFVFLQAP